MKLVLPGRVRDQLAPRLSAITPDSEVVWYEENGEFDGNVADAMVFMRWFVPPPLFANMIAAMPNLRWLHIPRAGVDGSLIPDVVQRDIIVTNSAGVHAIPISEFVLMFMLGHAKRSAELRNFQAAHTWRPREMQLQELAGKTLLIIGLGQIGQAIAERAAAFGMHVIGTRRRPRPTPGVSEVLGDDGWRERLVGADYVVIAAPLTAETRGMIGTAELAAMNPNGYLINIARGEIVDEPALIAALQNATIAGAALDVFAQEPLPAESPLWDLPNLTLTPHISWSSPEIWPRTLGLFLENLRRYCAGEPLRNVVDKHAGY
ncbi:MAG: D-2-hydroxyacid dehydrogenase [Oscillochloris sp.]|nr:D-2-hydroxyacid dehydrogenase [Oscillochloris sp.]